MGTYVAEIHIDEAPDHFFLVKYIFRPSGLLELLEAQL